MHAIPSHEDDEQAAGERLSKEKKQQQHARRTSLSARLSGTAGVPPSNGLQGKLSSSSSMTSESRAKQETTATGTSTKPTGHHHRRSSRQWFLFRPFSSSSPSSASLSTNDATATTSAAPTPSSRSTAGTTAAASSVVEVDHEPPLVQMHATTSSSCVAAPLEQAGALYESLASEQTISVAVAGNGDHEQRDDGRAGEIDPSGDLLSRHAALSNEREDEHDEATRDGREEMLELASDDSASLDSREPENVHPAAMMTAAATQSPLDTTPEAKGMDLHDWWAPKGAAAPVDTRRRRRKLVKRRSGAPATPSAAAPLPTLLSTVVPEHHHLAAASTSGAVVRGAGARGDGASARESTRALLPNNKAQGMHSRSSLDSDPSTTTTLGVRSVSSSLALSGQHSGSMTTTTQQGPRAWSTAVSLHEAPPQHQQHDGEIANDWVNVISYGSAQQLRAPPTPTSPSPGVAAAARPTRRRATLVRKSSAASRRSTTATPMTTPGTQSAKRLSPAVSRQPSFALEHEDRDQQGPPTPSTASTPYQSAPPSPVSERFAHQQPSFSDEALETVAPLANALLSTPASSGPSKLQRRASAGSSSPAIPRGALASTSTPRHHELAGSRAARSSGPPSPALTRSTDPLDAATLGFNESMYPSDEGSAIGTPLESAHTSFGRAASVRLRPSTAASTTRPERPMSVLSGFSELSGLEGLSGKLRQRSGSDGELRLPGLIRQTQGKIEEDLERVKLFSEAVQELGEMQRLYKEQLAAVLSASEQDSSTSPSMPSGAFDTLKKLAAAARRLEIDYRSWWEEADALIGVGEGPSARHRKALLQASPGTIASRHTRCRSLSEAEPSDAPRAAPTRPDFWRKPSASTVATSDSAYERQREMFKNLLTQPKSSSLPSTKPAQVRPELNGVFDEASKGATQASPSRSRSFLALKGAKKASKEPAKVERRQSKGGIFGIFRALKLMSSASPATTATASTSAAFEPATPEHSKEAIDERLGSVTSRSSSPDWSRSISPSASETDAEAAGPPHIHHRIQRSRTRSEEAEVLRTVAGKLELTTDGLPALLSKAEEVRERCGECLVELKSLTV